MSLTIHLTSHSHTFTWEEERRDEGREKDGWKERKEEEEKKKDGRKGKKRKREKPTGKKMKIYAYENCVNPCYQNMYIR